MEKNLLIDSLQIKHFKGLNHVLLDDFSQVNIFVGANNCGKTSVLEALKILSAPNDIGQIVHLALQRARVSAQAWQKNLVNYLITMFQKPADDTDCYHFNLRIGVKGKSYQYDATGRIVETVDSTGMPDDMLKVSVKKSEDGIPCDSLNFQIAGGENTIFYSDKKQLYHALYVSSATNYYRSCVKRLSDYIIRVGKADVFQMLQTFDKSIDDISIVGEDIYLHSADCGSLPLFAYGAGMQKAIFLATYLVYCKNGVILVDEIDNAIHISAFEDVFTWFLDACRKWNVQAFVTTHSAEAIDAILKTVHNQYQNEDILRIITLRKDYSTNNTWTKVRSGEEAYHDRTCFEMELRV